MRLELSRAVATRYHKIAHEPAAMKSSMPPTTGRGRTVR
jgi:hypothetical protein